MVGTGRGGYGRDADGGSGGRTDGGGGGNIRDRDGLNWWEDNIANITLGTEPNDPLAYAPVLQHNHPAISTLVDPRDGLERERYTTLINTREMNPIPSCSNNS